MDGSYRTDKYKPDNLSFLGLLILGLLTALGVSLWRLGPYDAGRQVVEDVRRKGISSFLEKQGREHYFLIRDNQQIVGFNTEVFGESSTPDKAAVEAAGHFYIAGAFEQEQLTVFQSDEAIGWFAWRTETAGARGTVSSEVRLKDGLVTASTFDGRVRTERFELDGSMMPSFLLDMVFAEMVQSGHNRIILGLIESDGTVTTARVTRDRQYHPRSKEETAEPFRFRLELLRERPFSETVYLDRQGRTTRMLLQSDRLYLFERTTAESIKQYFPIKADYILKRQESF